jgi:hypothetical protein
MYTINYHIEKLLKGDGHCVSDLVSLDIKSESIQKFLHNVVVLVNQHSQKINVLESDKINVEKVKSGNYRLFEANRLSQNVLSSLGHQAQKYRMETYDEIVDGLASNMKLNANCNTKQ